MNTNAIVEYLQGTILSLDEACSHLGIDADSLTLEELATIDSEIFCCEDCGWWYCYGELAFGSEDPICESCFVEREEY